MKKTIILAMCILAIASPVFAGRFQPSEHLFEKSDDFQIIDVSKDFKHYEEGELDYSERDENPEHWGKVIGTESREMVFRTNDYIPKDLQGIVTEEDRQWIINWWKTNTNPIEDPTVRWSRDVAIFINDPTLKPKEKLKTFYKELKTRINNLEIKLIFLSNVANPEESYTLFEQPDGQININDSYFTGEYNPEGRWRLPSF